jgi:hypothetical protein
MGKFFAVLMGLIVALAVGGYYNYQRNAPLDKELENRAYASLSDQDLEALISAHTAERDAVRSKLGGGKADPTRVMYGYAPSDLKGKVKAFDHFQKRNSRLKELNRVALQHQVVIEAIQLEQSIRERGLDEEWTRIMRRVTTL